MYPSTDKHSPNDHISLQDAKAFKLFYSDRYLIVFRYIYGLHGGPTEDVEDLTSETFLRAWKSRHDFQGSNNAALGWLLKIARNLVIDNHRQQKTRGVLQDLEKHILPSKELGPEEQAQVREQIKILWMLIQALSDQYREILVLRYLLGWQVQEIGNHLEMKENTVSVYIRRAIKQLQEEWPTGSHSNG